MFTKIAMAALALCLMTGMSAAQDSKQDLGPATGTKAPDIGMPLDQDGKPHSFASLMGDNGVVLFFFRSAVW